MQIKNRVFWTDYSLRVKFLTRIYIYWNQSLFHGIQENAINDLLGFLEENQSTPFKSSFSYRSATELVCYWKLTSKIVQNLFSLHTFSEKNTLFSIFFQFHIFERCYFSFYANQTITYEQNNHFPWKKCLVHRFRRKIWFIVIFLLNLSIFSQYQVIPLSETMEEKVKKYTLLVLKLNLYGCYCLKMYWMMILC